MDDADWHEWIFQGEKSISAYYSEYYLWSHAGKIDEIIRERELDASISVADGVEVNSYIAISERLVDDQREPIGVMAHELGHYLGLPDLYDTENDKTGEWAEYEVGSLSVMADGGWGVDPDGGYIPYSMDVWSRYALG